MNIYQYQSQIEKVAREFDLKLVILYGSCARGEEKADSDIDIAVLGNKVVDFEKVIDLNNCFLDIFKKNEIDVKSLHNVGPLFRWQVMKDGILLFGKEYDFSSFHTYAFRDYMESQSLFKLADEMLRRKLERAKKSFA